MAHVAKILAFAGSTRTDSYNKKLVKVAMGGAEAAGAQVTFLDLRDLNLPLYDGDLEASDGLPSGARKFKDLLLANDGIMISSPEYNSSISGVLKNAIDWGSRPVSGQWPLAEFKGKIAVLMSASPGPSGGLRGLVPVRSLLGNMGMIVLPEQVTVSTAHEAFNPDGTMKDAKKKSSVEDLGRNLAAIVAKLKSDTQVAGAI
jgi:NAD(P)H-dependent FMN reductase